MKLKLTLKEIAMPVAAKKKQYGWNIKGSRKNVLDTLANALRQKIINIIAKNEVDPTVETPVSTTDVISRLTNQLSGKFDSINLRTIMIRGTTPARGYGDDGFGGALYKGSEQAIYMNISYGYGKRDFDIYEEVRDFRKNITPKKGAKWANREAFQAELEKKKKPIAFSPERDWPKFTESKTINEENYKKVGKTAPVFTTPEQVQEIYEKVRPDLSGSPNEQKRSALHRAFNKLSDKFLTLVHEAAHAKQFASEKRLEQLASYARYDRRGKSLVIPMMTDDRYQFRDKEQRLYYPNQAPSKATALGLFVYYVSPIEIDARIRELRRNIESLKFQARKNPTIKPYAEAFQVAKKREEAYANTINVRENIDTNKLATEELREKYLYQFYYQLSLDAKAIFNSDPRYKEELEKHKANVEAINQQIEMLINARTVNGADDKQKEVYAYWITNFERSKKQETGQPEQAP